MDQIKLAGLDFGSTTSSAIIASARVHRNSATNRMELRQSSILYRSEISFTPFIGNRIDDKAIAGLLDRWIDESRVDARSLSGGGAIVTGLAAQAENVAVIEPLVRDRISDVLFATAADPCLESWLAFMGSCMGLSRAHPGVPFLNLDIGGGTTNLALGVDGEVLATGCLFAGARHFRFAAGTYRITALSGYASRLLEHLRIDKSPGDSLAAQEVDDVVSFYVSLIEASVLGDRARMKQEVFRHHEQVPFATPAAYEQRGWDSMSPVITLSGGVGELAYRQARGDHAPSQTFYGDLGIDLAAGLLKSPVLSRNLRTHVPVNSGYATVYGLSLHSTEVSGATLYLPDRSLLPLRDLPIVARLSLAAPYAEVRRAVDLAGRCSHGGCIEITGASGGLEAIRAFGSNIANAVRDRLLPPHRVLVLFVSQNVGKAIGSYATDWGTVAVKLIVLDELATRNARFANLGSVRDGVVPVSFYGIAAH
jgi:ethanolamine utilization protein EutA